MSLKSNALLILVVITLFVLLPPTNEFFLLFLRRLSVAGLAALGVLIALLLFRSAE